MAERLAYLEAVVGADVTQFRKGMRDIRNEVGFLSETVRGLTGLGRSLTFAYTTPVLALGTAALTTASQFQASMQNINAIAGLTSQQLNALSDRTLEFGARTRAGANAASDALYTVFSAGLTNVEDAFGAMEVATYTAEAGLADMTTTTETLIAVMLSYGDTSEEAAWRTSNAITQMVAVGVGSMQQFSTALSSVIPTAASAGMSFDELAADMAFLTQRGLSASRAGVSLNAAIEQMVNPTEAMSSAFSELGARGLPDLIEQFGSVNGAIEALIGTADGDLTRLFQMFNSRQARRAVGLFANDLEGWNSAIQEFTAGVEGATMRAWEEQMKSFSASWDLLTSAVEGAGIAIGQTMFPILQPLIDGLTSLVLIVTDASPELLSMATAFITVTAVIPPLLWLLGSLISPFGVLMGTVSALAIAFYENFMGIRDIVESSVQSILDWIAPLTGAISEIWDVFNLDTSPNMTVTPEGTLADPYQNITVEEPTSLWDIYEQEGYGDYFSWDEFIARAVEGGWTGEAITPGDNITIDMSDTGLEIVGEPRDVWYPTDDLNEFQLAMADADTVGERIAVGVEYGIPLVRSALNSMWLEFTIWLNEKGSAFLDGIAGWFTPGAGSQIYTAFTQLLQGDLIGAITTVAPQIGQSLANTFGNINLQETFGAFTTSLTNLLNQVGSWLLSTGIPLVSQSFGYFAGRLAVLLQSAVSSAFTGGNANAVGEYVGEGIVDPFTTGFSQAVEGSDLEGNPLETMLYGALSTWVLGLVIAPAIFSPLTSMLRRALASAVVAGFTNIFGGFSFLGAAASLTRAVGSFAISAFTTVGGALAGGVFAGILITALLPQEFKDQVFNLFWQGLADIFNIEGGASELAGNVESAIYNGIMWALEGVGVVEPDAEIGVATGSLRFTGSMIDNQLTNRQAEELLAQFNIENMLAGLDMSIVRENVFGGGQQITGLEMPDKLDISQDGLELVYTVRDLSTSIDYGEMQLGMALQQAMLDGLATEEDRIVLSAMLAGTEIIYTADGGTIELQDNGTYTVVPPSGGSFPVDTDIEMTANSATITGVDPAQATDPADTTALTMTIPNVEISPIAMSFADDFLAGGDASTIIAEQFVPLEEAWVSMFAPDGLMASNFGSFSSGVEAGWIGIQTAVNDATTTINDTLPAAATTLDAQGLYMVSRLGMIKSSVMQARDEFIALTDSINDLLEMEGSFNIEVNVSGSVSPDGSHKTGLDTVPYDGYIAELHKGEMVLTASEANSYRRANVPNEVVDSGRSTGGNTTYTTVNIQGALTPDEMLREFKRRGINLQ